jgi:UDP-N-acetylmuramate--alanine ligase
VGAWRGNLRPGGDHLYVVEADEYDRSFLALAPTVAVVTNIEADHLDIYADLADIRGAFSQFASGARTIVLCGDDMGAHTMRTPSGTEILRYAIAPANGAHQSGPAADARLVAHRLHAAGTGTGFDVIFDDEPLGTLTLRVPGRHNVLNALGAIGSGLALGATLAEMSPGLEAFLGVERRFERVGDVRGITIVDDYAHHPTEIAATLAAARAAFPGRRIVAAFQPHLFSRTRDFATEFGEALAAADAVYLLEIYPAREKPMPGVTATLIADAVTAAGGVLRWRGARDELADALAAGVCEGDVVLTMGAGDITRTAPELLRRLSAAR